jgi:hypothetical protein
MDGASAVSIFLEKAKILDEIGVKSPDLEER